MVASMRESTCMQWSDADGYRYVVSTLWGALPSEV